MRTYSSLKRQLSRILLTFTSALVLGPAGCTTTPTGDPNAHKLTDAEVVRILDQAEAAASAQPSLLRVNAAGEKQTTRMHIIVMNRGARTVGRRSMADAWHGSLSIATMKAYTAMCFSSDQNALTTRSLGALTQPGGPLWNIGNSNRGMFQPGLIEFPGGLPLYKNGVLVGGIGVSGDGVDEDEIIALAGVKGYEAPEAIRIDKATSGGVPYVK
jgi:uncharacterized protein GlcG (DUF336 family)